MAEDEGFEGGMSGANGTSQTGVDGSSNSSSTSDGTNSQPSEEMFPNGGWSVPTAVTDTIGKVVSEVSSLGAEAAHVVETWGWAGPPMIVPHKLLKMLSPDGDPEDGA